MPMYAAMIYHCFFMSDLSG